METYNGHIKTAQDAILVFEACRLGLVQRVQRRLSEKERNAIRSGSVFVWDEREAGMRRWTDGKSWSASRVSGSFLTYRELDSKRKVGSNDVSSDEEDDGGKPRINRLDSSVSTSSSSSSSNGSKASNDSYRYKEGGLVKQSFSITTSSNQKLHLISYYTKADVHADRLPMPVNDMRLQGISIPKGLYPETSAHGSPGHTHATTHHGASVGPHVLHHIAGAPYALKVDTITNRPVAQRMGSSMSSMHSLHKFSWPNTPNLSSGSSVSSGSPVSEDDLELPTPHQHQHQSNGSMFPSVVVKTVVPLVPGNPGFPVVVQDIPWEKVRNSEDERQLNALSSALRL